MKYLLLTILVFLFVHHNCNAQKVDSLFSVFKKQIDAGKASCINMDEETEIVYYLLLDNSNSNELVKYTDDDNPAIRCLIYSGLAMKNTAYATLSEI